MPKAAPAKKTKADIAKAATKKKAPNKVLPFLPRNGPRARSKKKPTTPSLSIRPPTTACSLPFPNSASTFQRLM